MPPELVIFDMDGVLFEGHNFWLDLHNRYGTAKRGLELAEQYLTTDYETLAIMVARDLWKGKPASTYDSMVEERIYQPGVKDVFRYLNEKGIRSVIVSSGPYDLAKRAQKDLGIDAVWANRLSIEHGRLTGDVEVMVRDHGKQELGRQIIADYETSPAGTAFIGDSDADAGLAEIVGLSVSYNSNSEALKRVSKYVLEYGELEKLTDIFESMQN